MKNATNKWLGVVFCVFIFLLLASPNDATDFVRISLPKGVSIELPANWVVLSKGRRITIDTFVKSDLNLIGTDKDNSDLSFAANYYKDGKSNGEEAIGIVNIRYYTNFNINQKDVRETKTYDIKQLDMVIKDNITNSMKVFGMSIVSWEGTKKYTINGITVFVTEYHRKALKSTGVYRVRLVRVLAGDRSFTLTVSYSKDEESFLKAISDRIISSLRLAGISEISGSNSHGMKPSAKLPLFKDIKWGMTPEELERKIPQISLYSQRQKSGLANASMFAGTRLKTENGIVTIEYGGLGPNSNLEIIMVFVEDPTRNRYFEYKKMLETGYGTPERSTEISGSMKHPVGKGMLESHWDEFDRNVIIKLVYNPRGNPPRLNMVFSSIKAANKITDFYNRK